MIFIWCYYLVSDNLPKSQKSPGTFRFVNVRANLRDFMQQRWIQIAGRNLNDIHYSNLY